MLLNQLWSIFTISPESDRFALRQWQFKIKYKVQKHKGGNEGKAGEQLEHDSAGELRQRRQVNIGHSDKESVLSSLREKKKNN